MSAPLAVYDPSTDELRSSPTAFAERDDSVDSIVWEKDLDDNVLPGDLLATVQWAGLPNEALNAPLECAGKVKHLNRNIVYEDLSDPPSQFLAQIS